MASLFFEKKLKKICRCYLLCLSLYQQKETDMRTPDNNHRLFNRIDSVINEYVKTKSLFSGGCCYAAAVIAKELSSKNIPYKVAIFQQSYALRCRTLKSICKKNGCAHVAIVVNDNGKDRIIGNAERVEYYLNNFDKGWEMKVYDNIDWMQLESAYYGNEWNWAYNTSNNPHLSNDIKNVFNKYCSSK